MTLTGSAPWASASATGLVPRQPVPDPGQRVAVRLLVDRAVGMCEAEAHR